MNYISASDYLLLIPYLVGFYLVARFLFRREKDKSLRGMYFLAFWLRIIGCILYSMVMQYYYGYGDSFTFFKGSMFFTDRIGEDFSNVRYLFASMGEIADWYKSNADSDPIFAGYFSHPSGNMVMKISAVLSFVSFNRFLIISLFFAFFSFYGQWKLFSVFDHFIKRPFRKILAIAVLMSPSIWFWGSGLMKDSLCLGGLGLITYILFQLYEKNNTKFSRLLLLAIVSYMIYIIKSYVIVIFFISVILTLLLAQAKRIKNFAIRMVLAVCLLFAGIIGLTQLDLSSQIDSAVGKAVAQIAIYQNDYLAATEDIENSKGTFSMAEIDPTLGGILKQAPNAIFSCLFRPFIWESGKLMIFFTSLESTVLLMIVLYLLVRSKFWGFFRDIFSSYFLFLCFLLTILFALLIGFTTFNFGTMIRYKIIFLPYCYFLLVAIYSTYARKSSEEVLTTEVTAD